MDAGRLFQPLGRLACQRRAVDVVAIGLPCLAGRREHRALARPGETHNGGDALRPGDVLDGRPLLVGQERPRADRRLHAPAGDAKPAPFGHAIGADRHIALDANHFPRRIAGRLDRAPALVTLLGLQLHQSRRCHHLHKGRLERIGIADIAMQRARYVVPVEHALFVRDERQHLFGLFADQLGVAVRRFLINPNPRHGLAAPLHLRGMDAHVLRRLDLKPALLMRAMVDPHFQSSARQVLVRPFFPADANIPKLLMRSRQPQRLQALVLQFQFRLFAQSLRPDLPRRHHDVRVVIQHAAIAVRAVDREIHRHAIPIGEVLGELPRQLKPLLG